MRPLAWSPPWPALVAASALGLLGWWLVVRLVSEVAAMLASVAVLLGAL